MEFDTFDEARRAALFQAVGRETVVVKRGDKFLTLAKAEATERDTILGHCTFRPDAD